MYKKLRKLLKNSYLLWSLNSNSQIHIIGCKISLRVHSDFKLLMP